MGPSGPGRERRGRRHLALAVVGLAALLAGPWTPRVPTAAASAGSICDRFGSGEEAGRVIDGRVTETSGVVASRIHAGTLWIHNDSGSEPELFAVNESGSVLGTYRLNGAEALDWEDIAIGPGSRRNRSDLFVGDIGSNFRDRDHVTVYRVAEPVDAPNGTTVRISDVEELRLRYPGGSVDAEAMLVDPLTGDLYILTKEDGFSRVMRAPRESLRADADIVLEHVASFDVGPAYPVDLSRGRIAPASPLPGTLVTGADISPDGSTILVRTYQEVLAFTRDLRRPMETAFSYAPCIAPQRDELQGEAIGFAADGSAYFTIGEVLAAPVHRFAVTPAFAAHQGRAAPCPHQGEGSANRCALGAR